MVRNTESQPLTVAELARQLGASVIGDETRVVRRVATLEEAGEDALSWLGDAKYAQHLRHTRAAAVLVPENVSEVSPGATLLVVRDPDIAMCDALRLLGPGPEQVPPGIHPTAVIAPGAEIEQPAIGPLVTVGPGSHIGPGTQLHAGVRIGANVRIGRDCVLWSGVVVRERCTLGDRVTVHAGTIIGADGFGYHTRRGRHVKIPHIGGVAIEDDVEIGANCCIDRARSGVTRIGRGTKIDNLVQIAHNCDIGEDCIIVAQCGISGSTTLEHHVVLAGQVGLIDHLRVGAGVTVAAQSGVTHDVPPGTVYRGTPATDDYAYRRSQIALRRLPEMMKQFKDLVRRVEELESAADHKDRS